MCKVLGHSYPHQLECFGLPTGSVTSERGRRKGSVRPHRRQQTHAGYSSLVCLSRGYLELGGVDASSFQDV